ncbi:sulfatase [Coraliomargarita sp. W4R53]
MRNRHIILTIACCIVGSLTAATLTSAGQNQVSSETNRPNFIFILLDDAGWRDMGFSGNDYIETPHLDRLAEEGIQFTQAYSTHAFCTPSRQSLLSGQWPARTAWMQQSELNHPNRLHGSAPFSPAAAPAWTQHTPEFTSIAEALKSVGYATAHIGKWHFHGSGRPATPESEGFDYNFGGLNEVGAVKSFFAPYEGLPNTIEAPDGEYLTDRLTEETIHFIKEHRDQPFFIQLWHYAPHTPIQAPEAVVQKYRDKREAMGDNTLNPTYAAMIDVVDQGVARIMDTLAEMDLTENTIIIFASDNGGVASLGSVPVTSMAPLRGHKQVTYEGGLRVPMFIHGAKNQVSQKKIDAPVSLIDFYPTVLEMANIPLPSSQPVDGISLLPILKSSSTQHDELSQQQEVLWQRPLFWYNVTSGVSDSGEVFQPVAAMRRGDWRLVKNFASPIELYDLSQDPSESHNLAQEESERATTMEKTLDAWLSETGVAPPSANKNYDPDYVIPQQIKESTFRSMNTELVDEWLLTASDSIWKPLRMVKSELTANALRMHADGLYPEITTRNLSTLPAGKYLYQVELSVATSGRIRGAWRAGNVNGNIEFFPNRDGNRHTLTALFEAQEPIQQLRFAAPTHLEYTGHYDPRTQPNYIDVHAIRIYKLVEDQ